MNRGYFTYSIFIACLLLVIFVTFSGISPVTAVKSNVTKVTLQIKNSSSNVTKINLSAKKTSSGNVSEPVYNMDLGIMSPGSSQASAFSGGNVQSFSQPLGGKTTGGSSNSGSEGNLQVFSPPDSSNNIGFNSGKSNDWSISQPAIAIPTYITAAGKGNLISPFSTIAGFTGSDRIPGAGTVNDKTTVSPVNNPTLISAASSGSPQGKGTIVPEWTPYLWACKNANSYECAKECVIDSRVCPGNNPWYTVNCDVSTSIGCICQKNPDDPGCPCFKGYNDENPNCKCLNDMDSVDCAEACVKDSRSCPGYGRCEISLSKGCICMKDPDNPVCPCIPGKNDGNPNCNALLDPVNSKSCDNPTSQECADYCQAKSPLDYPECNKVKSIPCSDPTTKQCYDYCVNQPQSQWCKDNIDCITNAYSSQCKELCQKNPDSYACVYCGTPAGKNSPICNGVNLCTIAPSSTMCKEYCSKHPHDLKCLNEKSDTGPCNKPTSQECADYCWGKSPLNYPECNKVKSIPCNDPTSKQCYDYCINQPESQWCKENIDCLNDAYSSQCKNLCKDNPDSYACAYCKTPAGKNDPACNDVNMCVVAPSGTMCKEYCSKHPGDLKCLPVKITAGSCSKPTSQECADYCWAKSPLDYPECNQVKTIACSDPKSEACANYCKVKPGSYGCPESLDESAGSLKFKVTPALAIKLNVTKVSIVKKTV